MTNQIIHDPTRGWLLLTEWWPEKEYLEDSTLWNAILDREIAHCLSTAIEIDENDWDALLVITKAVINTGTSKLQDHHPYSVDAEFEVVWRNIGWRENVKIARLVKAKEHPKPFGTESERDWKEDYEQENGNYQNKCCKCDQLFYGNKHRVVCKICATDSVTSDGTPVKPTETQDELWDEIVRDCTDPDGFLDIDLARKSFRIERI